MKLLKKHILSHLRTIGILNVMTPQMWKNKKPVSQKFSLIKNFEKTTKEECSHRCGFEPFR